MRKMEATLQTFCRQHRGDMRVPELQALTEATVLAWYQNIGLSKLLNAVISLSVPATESDEAIFVKKSRDGRIDTCIRDNLMGSVCLLASAVLNDAKLVVLGETFRDLYECGQAHRFEPPHPDKPFDYEAHDRSLEKFKECLTTQLIKVSQLQQVELIEGRTNPLTLALVVYGRSQFESCCYQGPPRLTLEEATRDANGESDLWAEYLETWDLMKYIRV
jgi:hypothetical protein